MSVCPMFRVVPFKKEHVDLMNVRPHETTLLSDEALVKLEQGSIAITGVIDGRVISCGGVIPLYNGVAELWQIPSVYVSEITMRYARYIRRWLEGIREEFLLHRMETLCLDDDLHNRWMRFLGFEREGVKRKFINGNDYVMWGRVWE